MKEYLSDEGYLSVGAGFEVYNELGFGLSEEIYQQSLELELTSRNIPYARKKELEVYYKKRKLVKTYIPDLVLYGEIILELKAVKELVSEHESQLLNYMRISRSAVGYLLNFGNPKKMEWKRFIIKEYIPMSVNKRK